MNADINTKPPIGLLRFTPRPVDADTIPIGTKVRIQVSRVDLDGRKIDFRLVPKEGMKGDDLMARAMRDKGVSGAGGHGNFAHPSKSAKSGKSRSDRSGGKERSEPTYANPSGQRQPDRSPKSVIAARKKTAKNPSSNNSNSSNKSKTGKKKK